MKPEASYLKVEIQDARFRDLVPENALLVTLASEDCHNEGPVYIPADDSLVWSDVSGDRLLRWHDGQISTVRASCYQNGNALDHEGWLTDKRCNSVVNRLSVGNCRN